MRPSLKARDIEALVYIHSPRAQSPLPEIDGQRSASRGSSAMVLVTAAVLLLAALLMYLIAKASTANDFSNSALALSTASLYASITDRDDSAMNQAPIGHGAALFQ